MDAQKPHKGFKTTGEVIAGIVVLAVIAIGGYLLFGRSSQVVMTSPVPIVSESPTTTPVDTSTWLTYTNPTYHIVFQYPEFYSNIKRTAAYEAMSGTENKNSVDYMKVTVLLHSLNGTKFSVIAGGGGSQGNYIFSSQYDSWQFIDSPQVETQDDFESELDSQHSFPPRSVITAQGIKAWVSEYTDQHSTQGWCNYQTAFIESSDNKFVLQIDTRQAFYETGCARGNEEQEAQGGNQTIYQILDTLRSTEPPASMDISVWKTYRDDQYGFKFQYPGGWLDQTYSGNPRDIHISNKEPGEFHSHVDDFLGLEIQLDNEKDPQESFESFVRSQVEQPVDQDPGGTLTARDWLPGHKIFEVEYAGGEGWTGPGYYVEQSADRYIYVYSGDRESVLKNINLIHQIFSSFRFTN